MSDDTEEWCKVWRKTDFCSKNNMGNLVNFDASCGRSENFHFYVLILSVAYKVSAKKLQKNFISWHWKKIQNFE